MQQRRWLAMAALALMLPGCATRGPITLSCPILDSTVIAMPPSRLEQDIMSDAVAGIDAIAPTPPPALVSAAISERKAAPANPLLDAFRQVEPQREAAAPPAGAAAMATPTPPVPVRALLLSGGGQWGAFGAGFLHQLQQSPAAIHPDIVTGVSTGGLQSLFVAVGTREAHDTLVREYSPPTQAALVDANSTWAAAIKGSMAGIGPLRRAIERSLCTDGDPAKGCPMIDALATTPRQALIGFVEASSGRFMVANVNQMARHARYPTGLRTISDTTKAYQTARDCLTGAALASAGMPLFFQPVRIKSSERDTGKIYYDGGVRQSVFLASVAEAAAASTLDENGQRIAPPPTLYVIRNGPTQLLGPNGKPGDSENVDSKFDALTAALRAQSIIVNQVEIGSIAALRLFHPTGDILLATADGYQHHEWTDTTGTSRACDKGKERFFNPDFMACLRSLGRTKAQRPSPWISLTPLSQLGSR